MKLVNERGGCEVKTQRERGRERVRELKENKFKNKD